MRIKCLAFFLMMVIINVSASVLAQNINVSFQQTPLKQVLSEIQKQSGYRVMYNNKHLAKSHTVTFSIKNGNLKEVLEKCFRDQPLSYEIIEKTIVVKPKPKAETIFDKVNNYIKRLKVTGTVSDEKGRPIAGATVRLKGANVTAITTNNGSYTIDVPDGNAVLQFSYVGYRMVERTVGQNSIVNIALKEAITNLEEVDVVSTGYQTLPKERATGSFEQINNDLLNRSVGMNLTDHIKNLNAGIFFNNMASTAEPILIRGRNTIFSSTAPLIVLNNFPYDGDINNINPNDIENVTILKDAAAASIWGARAGNGVIVITTKRGTTNVPKVSFNNSVTIKQRPDITGMPVIGSADYIDLEKDLFEKGQYTNEENSDKINFGHPPFTPVVELLRNVRDGKVSADVANGVIEEMKSYNANNDIEQYLYRNALLRQHSLGISGNADKINYYFSAGWDKNLDNLIGKSINRISLRSQETFQLLPTLQVEAGINYTRNDLSQGNNPGFFLNNGAGKGLYPYARLVDDNGNPVQLLRDYNSGFIGKAQEAGLQDWTYNPIEDIKYTKNVTKAADILANAGLRYTVLEGLDLVLKYQYEHQQTNGSINYGADSFFARNLVNQFAQVGTDGRILYPIPKGSIVNYNNSQLASHQGRAQLEYHNIIKVKHEISAIAGYEIKSVRVTSDANRFYGYDPNSSTVNSLINYTTQYPQYNNVYSFLTIPTYDGVGGTSNRFISYYANASYIYNNRYIVSGSARQDGSNLFGVKTNQKTVPLWSAGAAWVLSKEPFYHIFWLPELKLRATYGYQGNVYNKASAYVTAVYGDSPVSGLTQAILQNPPNDRLRWERNATLNLGLDFTLARNVLSGSLEYYQKKSKDLMGYALYDPTTGIANFAGYSTFFGNVAGMKGKGVDMTLNANILSNGFKWSSSYLLSYNTTKITSYEMPVSPLGITYINDLFVNPVLNNPVYAVYSYKWTGLNPQNGNPRGYVNGAISNDYSNIVASTPLDSMVYNGPREPKLFGAWRNTFSYKDLSLSFNISYKFGYYFRTPSVNYTSLFNGWTGHSDYSLRWQKAGDENTTHIPSMVYPFDSNRDQFYTYSEVLVQKGDHIRLEDITLGYNLNKTTWRKLPFEQVKIYGYASGLGLIWKANKSGVDPDFINYPNPGRSFALGINLIF